MPREMSTHVVLMSFQQGMCGEGCYCVHRYGTLSQMRKLNGKRNDGSAAAWRMDSFDHQSVEEITMQDPHGNDLQGHIAKLTYRASLREAFRTVTP